MSKCTLRVTERAEGILHVEADTQYELASTFMRVQEFYESPYNDVRGHFFTHEYLMDRNAHGNKRSAQDRTVFSFLEDWNGFNVPGEVFNEWSNLFVNDLWEKEKKLIQLVTEKAKTRYYVIGTHNEGARGDFDHELSHAWYYLKPDYKKLQIKNLKKLSASVLTQLRRYIKADGYTDEVLDDEVVAYLATNLMPDTKDMMGKLKVPWQTVYEFQQTFADYKEEHFDEDY